MLEVVDLFCGAGGMTLGLARAGLVPRVGVDSAPDCIKTYRRNFPKATAIGSDLAAVTADGLLSHLRHPERFVLAGCPPCQLFSKLQRNRKRNDRVIRRYFDLIAELNAEYIVFENVPQIQNFPRVWGRLTKTLASSGYSFHATRMPIVSLGVPQHRERLVLLASKTGAVLLDPPLTQVRTVRDAIGALPDVDPTIPNHRTLVMSPENLRRIRSIKSDGGLSRTMDHPFRDSYARMSWDRPAPTITTKCISFSNGRFGHPSFDRAITAREAALLQGFPMDFVFEGNLMDAAKQVGNAVPPPVGELLGRSILAHERSLKASARRSAKRGG